MSIEKLDFEKVTKQGLPYTLFINSVIQFIHNAEALGVYVYLYSLPINWNINKEHLSKKFNLGNKKLRSIFSYLHRSNLLEYHREKDEKTGKMLGSSIHLLNGEKFDAQVNFKEDKTTQAKFACVEKISIKTTGSLSGPVENRPCGLETLQKKQIKKETKEKKREPLSPKFKIEEKTNHYVKGLGLNEETINLEHHKFYNHYLANGETCINWNYRYRKWMVKAVEYIRNKRK